MDGLRDVTIPKYECHKRAHMPARSSPHGEQRHPKLDLPSAAHHVLEASPLCGACVYWHH
eukprot:CAMPEP_0182852072 /NCGR_PEP_ID=MMETSP0006_2-20121128/30956_1 /TAXON_ID=97485 /ORGANISM="Prymnesium parvum, Strain Texoma1" /LENGTH=59 /DNA_ID=CAMNT_0024982767 /DNA_START=234 /DNA_END=413 /DNA_ORIENTATION=-